MNESKEIIYVYGERLDHVLSQGWYRGGNHVFTTGYIYYEENVAPGSYPVYWLRYDMSKFVFSKTQQRLQRASKQFEIAFVPFEYNKEYENLYFYYAQGTKFTGNPMLDDYLSGDFGHSNVTQHCIFDTHAVTIRDKGTLIGTGITDMGRRSMAGICNFYDPDYKKHSIGKMLLALKLVLARHNDIAYFYPGYIAPGISSFDYKTDVNRDCIEVWDMVAKKWVPYSGFEFDTAVPF